MPTQPQRRCGGLVFPIAIGVIPLTVFACFFHWQILIPTNLGWLLDGDWGAHLIGWNAFRHDAWRWPLGATRLLAWPTGVAVTFTDSNPLLSLLLKPFSGVLPARFQFVGPWLLACILLQFFAAHALLRHATESRWPRVIGAVLLTLLPALLARTPHSNLCAHWTILLSLHAFLNVEREGRRDLWFAALLTLSALIHPYFVLMNGAVWGSDLLRRSYGVMRRKDWPGLGALAARSGAVGAAPVAALWMVGGLSGYQAEIGGFGFYSMSLDAPFNPGRADYSRFLPAAPQSPGQVFEGFQYLGAGLLFLIAAAGAAVLAAPAARARLRRMGWLAWLAPAMLVLAALALSDDIQLHGRVVADGKLDWLPVQFTGAFRASGRLFWPCAYVLVLAALELVFSLRRALAYLIGLAALVLQASDLTGFAAIQRAWTEAATRPQRWERATSPAWEPLIAAAEVVQFEPPDPHIDRKLFYEIAWRASSSNRPVTIMYTARVRPVQREAEAAAHERFLKGWIDPRRLYVLMDGCVPAGVKAEQIQWLDGVLVIPAAGTGPAFGLRPAMTPDPFPLGRTVAFAPETPGLRCMLGRDWSVPEPWGLWSDGAAPELFLRLGAPPRRDLVLTVTARAYPAEGQGVSVTVGGRTVGRWRLAGEPGEHRVRIPREAAPLGLVHVVLKVDSPTSPKAQGISSDNRRLGVGLTSVRVE